MNEKFKKEYDEKIMQLEKENAYLKRRLRHCSCGP